MTDQKPEVAEPLEAEVVQPEPEAEENQHSLTASHMDGVIAMAAKIESFAKAMDTIIGVIIKRAYDNDWVSHDRGDVQAQDRKANIGAAAAERIAAFLGITERNWKARKEVADDGQSYTWIHEAEFTLGNRTIHVMGQAGTKDKFFGYADKAWKPLDEVKESDIRTASLRACRKEGVRTLLGLRNIPITRLQSLGLNIEKIKQVNFQAKIGDGEKKMADPSTGLIWKAIIPMEMIPKDGTTDGKPWTRWEILDQGRVKYVAFLSRDSKRIKALLEAASKGEPIKVGIKLSTYKNQEQYSIEKVEGVEEDR